LAVVKPVKEKIMPLLNGISTLLFFGFIVFALQTRENREGETLSGASSPLERRSKRIFILLFLALLSLRFFRFPAVPGGVNQDGAMEAVDARALADYGTDRFGTFLPAHFKAWGYGQMSVLLSYLTVPFIKVLGLNKLSMRLPMMLASLLGMWGVYGTVNRTHGKRTARIALLLTVINPWHFMQSRWALDCNLFPHMFLLGFCFLTDGLRKKRSLYLSMVFFALGMYCYGVSFYMVPFFLLTACVILLGCKKVTWREAVVCGAVYFGISWPIYGTMLINFMKWETVSLPFVTMPYFPENVRSGDILFFSEHMGQQLIINFKALLRTVFWQGEDLPWNSIKEFGTMYQCTMPFVALGAVLVFHRAVAPVPERGQENSGQIICARLLLAFWIYGLLTGILINSVNVNRINIIFYIHIIFGAAGISFIAERGKRLVPVIGVVFLIHYTCFCAQYFTSWAEEIDKAFYGDFIRALEYARECEDDYYCITPDTQYTGARQVTEILTMFVFDVDAGYFQGEDGHWEEKDIPYEQKFQYANPWERGRISENITYVIKSSDTQYFPQESFSITVFGDYAVAAPSE